MTQDEKLEQLRTELARQDAALDEAREQMEALGPRRLDVPADFFCELEQACTPTGMIPTALVIGIRG
jgi:hypothetical protein